MKIITPVEIDKNLPKISYDSKIVMFGSCFADQIGERLAMYGFDIQVNPFGTLYNMQSIYNSITRLSAVCEALQGATSPFFVADDLIERPDGMVVTYSHHSRYGGKTTDKKGYLKAINDKLKQDSEFFYKADTVILTLGTSYVFRLAGSNFVVSNCHKMPSKNFNREFLPLEECATLLSAIVDTFPQKRFILTVSPIRHLADGAHGNSLSKSNLLLAIDKAIASKKNLFYFPAYEIFNDELRDYRWYGEDLVHPTPMAIEYVFEKFKSACISESCYQKMDENLKIYKQKHHIANYDNNS